MEQELNKQTQKRYLLNPKTYRLSFPFYVAFEACIDIYGNEKRELFNTFLDNQNDLDSRKIKELPILTQHNLTETMIDGLKSLDLPFRDATYLKNEPKVKALLKYVNEESEVKHLSMLKSLRILPSYQDFINDYAGNNNIGEVLELAIALFINETSDYEYALIETVFKRLVTKEKAEQMNKSDLKFKTYRFDITFQVLFEVLLELHGDQRKRIDLLKALDGKVTLESLNKYPEYSTSEFVELILDQLKDEGTSANEFSFVMNDPRVNLLKHFVQKKLKTKSSRGRKNLKLSPVYDEYIKAFSNNVGDAIEYALAFYIGKLENEDFNIIQSLFEQAALSKFERKN